MFIFLRNKTLKNISDLNMDAKTICELPNNYKLKRRQTFECLKSNNILLFFCDENPCKRQRAHFSVFFFKFL